MAGLAYAHPEIPARGYPVRGKSILRPDQPIAIPASVWPRPSPREAMASPAHEKPITKPLSAQPIARKAND
jgi:hypothetical protein